MKRLLTLQYSEGCYSLVENDIILFCIKESDLKFDSLKFYQGIYMNKNPNIELKEDETIHSAKLGQYIFKWLNRIINTIKTNIGENSFDEDEYEDVVDKIKCIRLFDLAACAGDGLYVDSDSSEEYKTSVSDAVFAVRINGKSMEPTIPDGSIALVKQVSEYNNDDVVIVNYDGDALCKRYVKLVRGVNLVSDNRNGDFLTIKSNKIADCNFQGKVIAYDYNDKTIFL